MINNIFTVIIFASVLGTCLNYQKSYTAAVVDYVHEYSDYPKEMLLENTKDYLENMRNASRKTADIIVFPEYGLIDIYIMYKTASKNISDLDDYSTVVPDSDDKIAPCDDKNEQNYGTHLIKISCAARMHAMYTVINLLEKNHNNETGDLEFFNTNVVMDRTGTVIARYRKINLSEEPFLTPGDELVTFETDFGVTFGLFTCFDILFKYPALDILSVPEVTDIIFPTAWFSETPFLQSLSIQHGYAKANGVNMLAACLQEPFNQDGGSGIYLADGTIQERHVSAKRETKLIVQEVPVIRKRIPPSSCDGVKVVKKQIRKSELNNDIDNFPTNRDDMSGYVFEPLSKSTMTQKRVCSEDGVLCCYFNVVVDNNAAYTSEDGHIYKLAAFNGLRTFGHSKIAGIRTCAIIACLNESDDTCGQRTNSSLVTTTFKSIHIKLVDEKTNDTYYQPSTLQNDLTPTDDYIYCKQDISYRGEVRIIMASIEPLNSLLTFGIFGRVFSVDTIPTEPTPKQLIPLNNTLIMMILCGSIGIFLGSGAILWKCCTKKE